MALISDQEVQEILARVRARVGAAAPAPTAVQPAAAAAPGPANAGGEGVFASIGEAVAASGVAFRQYRELGLDRRRAIVEGMRRTMREHAEPLARQAREETGIGRAADKVIKNQLVTEKTPGPEDLDPHVVSGDRGLTITEYAPFGVIASITPTTNPTSTIINNSIAILAAGNSVIFNPHPAAKRVSVENVRLLARSIAAAGGPPNLLTVIPEPTIESARELMNHPGVRILLVTGGPAVVAEALKTSKRAITAGPGNPPVVVDETADLELAGKELVRGASFDNNLICTDEKEVFAVESVADELLAVMRRSGAVLVAGEKLRALERVIFEKPGEPRQPGVINRKWIGQDAARILAEIGVAAGEDVRLVVCDVPVDHPLVWSEQMMPVLPVARVRSADEGIDLAVEAEHGFRHTAAIFSRNVERITRMARKMNVSIFVANAPTMAGLGAGGEGFTSFSIATPTGEGLTRPRTFSRIRRMTLAGGLRMV